MKRLEYGWSRAFERALIELQKADLIAARVVCAERERYRVLTRDGTGFDAELTGKLRHRAGLGELPVVGDWVAIAPLPNEARATIAACLPRTSALSRKRPDRESAPQLIAANLDLVYVVSALDRDFNPRKLERALALVWESGAQPVVLLSKRDLCDDPEPYLEAARAVALGAEVHALSAHALPTESAGAGLDAAFADLQYGVTAALIGSSGVGKSTLVNRLLGHEQQHTLSVRDNDGRGRHATTRRELFVLASGALLIDTPGMRELGLFDADDGLQAAFDDVEALAAGCRFGDCGHTDEPGCALRDAIERGALQAARLHSYSKLQRELAHEARRGDQRMAAEFRKTLRRVGRERTRNWRAHPKNEKR